ncbi:HEAT repeat domain-containing protein [Planktothrix sp. FACHB-1355]|uniref:HEAT repeat domain-containing protein n=1 Tax=Aerosakkonema funiforme FACHB-1375 TaxID=2949571 RepID=A0A926VL19_9CYAN|nr:MULTISPECIES: HEAT repeat domain-containing protein [Oscillatoriales]MBD2185882.1 HEAT repeat domain-containing protein [Aerosakkonema funiforme FACHB-1375]MBD3560429.1 HEAT repeat domain-containing protein [Planktothrix sp. FACHB-1355]
MSFYPELDRLNLEELIDRFRQNPPEGEEYAVVYYQELASIIAVKGKAGIDFLLRQTKETYPPRWQAILFALSQSPLDYPSVRNLLFSYLENEQPMIVAEAIDSLCRIEEKDAVDRVLTLFKHPSPYVRGSVLRYITRLYPDKALPLLIEAFKDQDFIVRENAADEVGELGAVEAIPYLRRILEDVNPDVRQAAQTAIAMLESIA